MDLYIFILPENKGGGGFDPLENYDAKWESYVQ